MYVFTVHYTLSLENGTVIEDTRTNGEPFKFRVGDGMFKYRLLPELALVIGTLQIILYQTPSLKDWRKPLSL